MLKLVDPVTMKLIKNNNSICDAYANGDNFQMGVCSRVLHLDEGDWMKVKNKESENRFRGGYTALSGHLVLPDV